MNLTRDNFANEVIHAVRHICSLVFNIKSDEQLKNVLGITHTQLEETIKKIIYALPDKVFVQLYPRILEEIKNICAREFVFFQAQEKWDDPDYQKDLENFIGIFSRDMQQRISTYLITQSKTAKE